ncbi:VOC family protein [Celeribacter arenosi]|uniref:Glyoxalase/fosfomycin resistance/dioxygenase domain-containing protein n=1 Tax=Celeribacter arenosi TaxID=792649 RepID=A0ABP7KHK9_9RHOB
MQLGCFSVSLAVKDLGASIEFYRALGFDMFHDQSAHGWCMMRQGDTNIGLFQGMFEGNILTFNPGWAQDGQPLEGDFVDIRDIQNRLIDAGVEIKDMLDASGTGPAHITLADPDGNAVLIDQHVAKP